jgi:3-phosphoshikimate 1-carboxyvinyltransferase
MEISSNKHIEKIQYCPPSKSYANRALFLAALKGGKTRIKNIPDAEDVEYFANALIDLGLDLRRDEQDIIISKSLFETHIDKTELHLGEGGTTIRFMIVLLAALGGHYSLKVEKRFLKRPIDDLVKLLSSLGVTLKVLSDGFELEGKLSPLSNVEVDCSRTTQVASAFIMLEKLNLIQSVKLLNLNSSRRYIEMTKSMNFDDEYTVPADFSSLSYFIVWAIHHQELFIKNVQQLDPLQADSYLFEVLRDLCIPFKLSDEGLEIKQNDISGSLEVDCSRCLDLVPSLAYLFSYAKGHFKLTHIDNLKHKESDRYAEIIKCLKEFNVEYKLIDSGIEIKGDRENIVVKKEIHCSYDHRIVMMNSLFLKHNNGGKLEPAIAVNKSFPEFFDIFNS